MTDLAFLVDTTKCTGCRACQVACKQWNNLPAEDSVFFQGNELTSPEHLSAITYNHVIFSKPEKIEASRPVWQLMHKKCYHCENPNCYAVCPTDAISKNGGWIVIDQNLCIGCGACEDECVYNVPHVNDKCLKEYGTEKPIKKDRAYKCHACTVNKREIPACVNTCPTKALTSGIRIAQLEKAEKRLKEVKKKYPNASIYGKEQFGGLHLITILKDNPEKYGLPLNPRPVNAKRANAVKDLYSMLSIFTFGLPSLKRTAYKLSKRIVDEEKELS